MASTMKSTRKPAPPRPKASAAKTSSAKPAAKPRMKPSVTAAVKPSVAPTPHEGANSSPDDKTAALSREVGAALFNLVKQTPDAVGAAVITRGAQALAQGQPVPNQHLSELKDAVNAVAAQLRAGNEAALARQWSRANRGVRRLERASRTAS